MAGPRGGRRGWLVLVVLLFGGVLAAGRLVPAVRWYFRQRAARVVEEVRRRGIELPTFKLTRRGTLIHRLTHDPELIEAAEVYARENDISMAVAMARVERYGREIVPSFNAFLYFRVGIPLAAWISRSLYDIRVGPQRGLAVLDENAYEDASVVFVMNHRSNIDYVLLAHLMAHRTALSYAAGEWAHAWPLGRLIGGMGAFFVRRGSGDDLYRRVLERFVQMAVEGGLTQVFFPEGGLSRDGKLREPKVGLLDYMLRHFDPEAGDILFVPVGVNYDWALEDHSLLQPGGPEAGIRGRGGPFASAAGSMVRNLLLARRGGGFRLGAAAVGFGAPLSAREYAASRGVAFGELEREARIEEVKVLARLLMLTINDSIPPVAVPLVARALIEAPETTVPKNSLLSRARSLSQSKAPLDYEAALRTLVMRRLVLAESGEYRPAPGGEKLLAYYANSAHS
ncbi:MAG: 1-acyl-sn-glycerol-3-phosphate acyltransferase [Actinomycetota bacterium]|nr:1-acyl-sn-glycerol-3-phosphate acyltransferase [Rubrobacteraceae bacterium]MDQ3435974.1 1-acyl-sn-glycerol-3-phosphate acyltransferase [Actinomycetota bacterium]